MRDSAWLWSRNERYFCMNAFTFSPIDTHYSAVMRANLETCSLRSLYFFCEYSSMFELLCLSSLCKKMFCLNIFSTPFTKYSQTIETKNFVLLFHPRTQLSKNYIPKIRPIV